MRRRRALEGALVRAEAVALVTALLLMLALSLWTVVARQVALAIPEASAAGPPPQDDLAGFGGGFDAAPTAGPPASPEPATRVVEAPAAPTEPVAPPPESSWWAQASSEGWARQLVLVVGLLGAALAAAQGRHIRLDLLGRILPPHLEPGLRRLGSAAAAGMCCVLAYAGLELVGLGRAFPRDAVPGLPEWVFQLEFPVGFGLVGFHFCLRALGVEPQQVRGVGGPVA
jgi:TRAP-type C4-dicarboxylate transport system permease small subunit